VHEVQRTYAETILRVLLKKYREVGKAPDSHQIDGLCFKRPIMPVSVHFQHKVKYFLRQTSLTDVNL
jgi:hypothetical protein